MPGPHLTPCERGKIQVYCEQGMSRAEIGRKLGRHATCIGRELRRNNTKNGYDADKAQDRYVQRRKACRPKWKLRHGRLRAYMIDAIGEKEWSPEQVAGRLPLDYPEDLSMRISHETIYQGIYNDSKLAFLVPFLPQGRPKRRPRGQGKTGRGPSIPNRTGIEERPEHVEERREPGHWEADSIIGKGRDGFIVTLVERSRRLLCAVKTCTLKACEVAPAIIKALLDMPVSWVRTITFDNGTEFARHEQIAAELGVDTYFADPYAAYQRGTNENTNGLIRRFLPKGKSFEDLTQKQLDRIVDLLNNRPRKCLGYRTPREAFNEDHQERLRALSS